MEAPVDPPADEFVIEAAEEAPAPAPLQVVESISKDSKDDKKGNANPGFVSDNVDTGLGQCQGPCKDDDDCEAPFRCYNAGFTDSVPGCGELSEFEATKHCSFWPNVFLLPFLQLATLN